jgi:hypothetical protein
MGGHRAAAPDDNPHLGIGANVAEPLGAVAEPGCDHVLAGDGWSTTSSTT